jgi:hypothetical protein
MFTSFLFLLGAITLIFFVIIKIANPDEKETTLKNSPTSANLEKEWNAGAFLLTLGPIITGFGLLGWVITEWWGQADTRLFASIIITGVLYVIGYILYSLPTKNRSLLVLAQASLLLASFMQGAMLYSINDLYVENTGNTLLGVTEMFGIWFIINTVVAYLARSSWIFGVNTFVAFVWLAGYLNPNYNFAPLLGIRSGVMFVNNYIALALPTIVSSATALLYAWHQKMKHNKPKSSWRAFYYLSGLFSFLTVGALIFRSIHLYNNLLENSDSSVQVMYDLLIMIVVLILFGADFILKKSIKNYNINYLVAVSVPLAAIVSAITFPNAIFTGLFFIEVPFIVWILADYLRQNSSLAAPIFYTFNSIQLLALAFNTSTFNWFKIVVILSILMYAAVVHYLRRPLVYYTMIMGIFTLVIKILATDANGFLMIVLTGGVLMSFGIFYTQTRSRAMAYQNYQKKFNIKTTQKP